MKKLVKMIKNFFGGIWNIIEKIIVIPITKLIIMISNTFSKSGKKFETWLTKTSTLLFISLIIAIFTFISVDQRMLLFSDNSAEVLRRQPINVIYNEEAYVVEGIPETADITLIGRKSDLYFAKQSPSHDIIVDLSDLKPGRHRVELKYNQPLASIEYNVNPSEVTVTISPKISETRSLGIDVVNSDSLDSKLVINNISIDNDRVVIKGTEETLSKVASVKAIVDVKNLTKQEVGTQALKDITLKAYDDKGDAISSKDIEIVPGKVNAEVEILSPSKELPIKIIPVGELAFGYAINTLDANEAKLVVYGDPEVLDRLTNIPVEIDVTGLKENKQYKVEINKPTGIRSMSVNNLTINVSLGKSIDREISNVGITWRNLSDSYTAQGAGADDISVTVILKGVKEVVERIEPEDITAYIDLKNYSEGEHEVEVKVEGNDVRVGYVAKTKKVNIIIKRK